MQGEGLARLEDGLSVWNQAKAVASGTALFVFDDPSEINRREGPTLYDSGKASRHEFAVCNASLVAMKFMLAAWSHWVATRPMIGFEPYRVREAAGAPRRLVPLLALAVGYPDVAIERAPRVQKLVEEIIEFIDS